MIAKIVIIAFILLEASNVLALYFAPGSKRANAVGVFSAWEKSKQYPEIHDFVKYLVYWVAGAKLIFLFLLGGIAEAFYGGVPEEIRTPALAILSADLREVVQEFYRRFIPAGGG